MKKENVYVSLKGKTKDELTDLYNFLVGSGEETLRGRGAFLDYEDEQFHYDSVNWLGSYSTGKTEVTIQQLKEMLSKEINLMGYSVLVDNEEQAKKLQEYAFKKGFRWYNYNGNVKYIDSKSFQFGLEGNMRITRCISGRHYQDENITKKAHYNDLFPEEKETPQQEIERLKARISELENELPKVGDIVYDDFHKVFRVKVSKIFYKNEISLPTEIQEQLKKYL